MGYRSEVKSVIYGEPSEMDKFMADNPEAITQIKEDFGSSLRTLKMGDKRVLLYLDNDYAKWYDEFDEVQRWNELLELAVEANLNTEFVRVGEDSEGDIETDYTGDKNMNYLQPMTKIDVGFGYDGSLQEV
jgi:hypothetical protein